MKNLIFILTLILISLPCRSDVKLPAIFSDNMIIQRNMPIKIWGWAEKNERVSVILGEEELSTRAGKYGAWSIIFGPRDASFEPLNLEVNGKNSILLRNILIGDVWICSGQSNMFWTMGRLVAGLPESDEASYPHMRMFTVEREMALTPRQDLAGTGWIEAEGRAILEFSAVAYYFGKELLTETGIPIGLISTSWGGTNVESWTSMSTLKKYPHITAVYEGLDKSVDNSISGTAKLRNDRIGILKEFVYEGIGLQEEWQKYNMSFVSWDWIRIPQKLDNELFNTMDGAVWFKKQFDLPSLYRDKDIQFNLGGFHDHGMVWLNGHLLGESFEPEPRRDYRAEAKYLKNHDNEIIIRVFDTSGKGGIITGDMQMNFHPVGKPDSKQLLCGDWQYKISLVLQEPFTIPSVESGRVRVNDAPSSLFNQMIHPLLNLSITGAIWYQGEANAGRALEYSKLFPDMIRDWRMHWGQGDFPFLFVQLAAYDRPRTQIWPELREAQRKALELPNTGMAVTIDIGEPDNIHPQNKWDVGKRLALPALKLVYGNEIVYSGPVMESTFSRDGRMIITFSQVGEGLMVRSKYGYLTGFEVSDDNLDFSFARARIIDPNSIEVWSDQIKEPVYVRYAWQNYPEDASLFNSEKLPAAPFRTGTWNWITAGNRYGDQ